MYVENPAVRIEELKNVVEALSELGSSYEEALGAMSGVTKELGPVGKLWRKGDKSRLIKLGLTLIAFPEPTPISETLGAVVLAVGIVQTKMRQLALHIEDVYGNFLGAIRDLETINKLLLGR